MAVVVFDADVLIGFRDAGDANHSAAVERVRAAAETGTRRLLSAINYTEVLIGPLRAGGGEVDALERMLAAFAFELVPADRRIARTAASVRAQTNLVVPDAYAVATALDARRSSDHVRLESFDESVVRAYEAASRTA